MRILNFLDGFESATEPSSIQFPASQVSSTPSGNLSATTSQAAVNELQGDIDTINAKVGSINGIASLDSDGKIPSAQIPALALIDVNVVANIAARDALTVQEGDVALVTDAGSGVSKSYIYSGLSWIELLADGSLASHQGSSSAHSASSITNTPSGNLAATNVQSALNELQGDINTLNASVGNPSGSVIMFAGASAPSGWLMCDGSAIDRTTYSALFTAISTTYGVGNGSTTFNIPDTRGIFVRGAGTSASIGGLTYSGTLGTKQNDTTKKNGMTITDPTHSHLLQATSNGVIGGTNNLGPGSGSNFTTTSSAIAASTGITLNSGDAETRPANIALNYIIKT